MELQTLASVERLAVHPQGVDRVVELVAVARVPRVSDWASHEDAAALDVARGEHADARVARRLETDRVRAPGLLQALHERVAAREAFVRVHLERDGDARSDDDATRSRRDVSMRCVLTKVFHP